MNPNKKIRINKVEVVGVKRTHIGLIIKELNSIFQADTAGQLFNEINNAHERLKNYGIFKGVHTFLDNVKGCPGVLDIQVKVQEVDRLKLNVSAQTGANEGVMHIGCRLRNTLGLADVLEVETNHGYSRHSHHAASFTIPFSHQVANSHVAMSLYQNSIEQLASCHRETTRGTSALLTFPLAAAQYTCSYTCDWREIGGMRSGMPFGVRLEAGHSLKSSLQHSLVFDTREGLALPKRGHLLRLSQELAGLGGDVHFVKQKAEAQVNVPLPRNSVLSASLQGGVLLGSPWHADAKTHISDRFFLGGPLSIRGYHMRGVGPRDEGASLGGDVYAAGGLHLFTPVPFWKLFASKLRLHAFVTGGAVSNLPSQRRDVLPALHNQFAWSYGAGLALDLAVGRLELNYCFPQPGQGRYSFTEGLQIGVGLEFL